MTSLIDKIKLPMDKIQHFSYWAVGTLILAVLFQPVCAFLMAFFVGILKELYDKFVKQTEFDFYDLLADVLGIILGILIYKIIF